MAPAAAATVILHEEEHRRDDAGRNRSGSSDEVMGISLLEMASAEIERMRIKTQETSKLYHSFPKACLTMLKSMEGNSRCLDCGEHDPQWAAVSYGALLCLQCSGHHRSLGVQVSCVRSVSMDEWSLRQVLSMLEGGNAQVGSFFARHHLSPEDLPRQRQRPAPPQNPPPLTPENVTRLRYKTKAAQFYRQQMELHVERVLAAGPYRGREISRRLKHHRMDHRNSTLE